MRGTGAREDYDAGTDPERRFCEGPTKARISGPSRACRPPADGLPWQPPASAGGSCPLPAEFLTLQEVADLLRVAERTAYTLARTGKLPAMKIGNQWRIARSVLDEWARVGGGAPKVRATGRRGVGR